MDLFARQGFGASIRATADAPGVTSALITHHFRTKEALRRAVVVIGRDDVTGPIASSMAAVDGRSTRVSTTSDPPMAHVCYCPGRACEAAG